ncbi:MAG: hypothetical protein ACFFBC_08510 [Promethearchaeota archaeon]
MKIAVDVDGVIFDLVNVFLDIFNHKFRTTYRRNDISQWEFYKDWNVPESQVYEIFYQIYEGKIPAPLIDKKIPTLLKKINKNHHVDILSARNSNYKAQLKAQLQIHNIVKRISYNDIILVNEKPFDLKLQHQYDIYIDDNPNLVDPIKKMRDKTLFLFNQPWNKDSICEFNVISIENWQHLLKELKKIKKK